MLVSPDRLGWTYGGSLAADSQCRRQLLRNIHTHSWAQTHTPHLHKHTYRHSFESVVPSSELSPLPAVRLSQSLLRTSIVGILEPPRFPIIPRGRGQVSRTKGWCAPANAHPQRGRMGRQIKAKAANTQRAQSFVQRTVRHGSLSSLTSLSLCLLPRAGLCQLVLCVLSGAGADSWPENPFQESQVEFCVKQRSIIWRPDWQRDRSLSLFLFCHCAKAERITFSSYWSDPNRTFVCGFTLRPCPCWKQVALPELILKSNKVVF